ncbi:hypothetical protein [Nocardia neocaledoniensis]|uniref:hypothetical protein n=1 Tax=Nocardia neocaledoniensis TaxID=236511 RepID=UPI0024541F24|nr:hypothetical protein [Nocardia neocaledoniensis]
MKLDDLCELMTAQEFPAAGVREHPGRETVLAARAAVTTAVADDEFLTDCLAHELDLAEQQVRRRGLVPFYTLPGYGIEFSFGYWPPGRSAGVHEHTAWTITAVCRNELRVQTYDREKSYRDQTLVPKNLFDAPAGRVGFIFEPCIHDPGNPTDRWSLSLHVTSPLDGEKVAGDDRCLPPLDEVRAERSMDGAPYDAVLDARAHQALIRRIAEFAPDTTRVAARDLLDRCARLGSRSTRRLLRETYGAPEADPVDAARPRGHTAVRTHADLVLSCREVDDSVALGVETAAGWVEHVRMSRFAREAVQFCARTTMFDVGDIPGHLTETERWTIAETLEDCGIVRIGVS